jgi:hypothetical protein
VSTSFDATIFNTELARDLALSFGNARLQKYFVQNSSTPSILSSQCGGYYQLVAPVINFPRKAMKVALSPRYRMWMCALFPTTLGVGTAALWIRSLVWPLDVDEAGLTLRSRRRVPWNSVKKIGVSRSYLDGHVSEIRIHHMTGACKIPARFLQNGQEVVRIILAIFERTNRRRVLECRPSETSVQGQRVVLDSRPVHMGPDRAVSAKSALGNAETLTLEFAALRNSLAKRSAKLREESQIERERICRS